jgi:adenylate cyclase class IV
VADELELKAVVPDAAALRRSLERGGASLVFAGTMADARYDRGDELAPRDEVLRVRTMRAADGTTEWHLAWKGPTRRSPEGYKLRDERECRVVGRTSPADVLDALGYTVIHRIEREVVIYDVEGAMARIETYPEMDTLLEVEGAPAAIERAIVVTGLPRDAFSSEPLAAFVARFEARRRRALLARPG